MKRKICIILICLLLLITVISSYDVSFCNNNTMNNYTSFSITSDGEACVAYRYEGYPGFTEGAEIDINIQKRKFLFFWLDVATETVMVDGARHSDIYVYRLSETGTYKCTVKYRIFGSGGDDDIITFEDIKVYNKESTSVSDTSITTTEYIKPELNISIPDLDGIRTGSGIFLPQDEMDPSEKMIEANTFSSVTVQGDKIYYGYFYEQEQKFAMRYQNINDVHESGYDLDTGETFDSVISYPLVANDESAMEQNSGNPVFIMSLQCHKDRSSYHEIISYNTRNNKKTYIYRENDRIMWMALYGDHIFYMTTDDACSRYVLHRLSKDGSEHIEMKLEEAERIYVLDIYDGRLYYRTNVDFEKIYSLDIDFKDKKYVCDGLGEIFVNDGFLYYSSATDKGDLYRRNLDTLEEEKCLRANIGLGHYENNIFYYYKRASEESEIERSILYGFVPKTGEEFVVFEASGLPEDPMYAGWNEKYLICNITFDRGTYFHLAINIQTGEKVVIPK